MNSNHFRIEKYASLGAGLERSGPVRLSPHAVDWHKVFDIEAQYLSENLQIPSLRLYHVGSTSIPELIAKPIIDICASVQSLAEVDKKQELLETLGYEWKGEFGISGRRYAVLCNQEKTIGYVHLHCYEIDHPEIERHLLFRNYLRKNKSALEIYSKKKLELTGEQIGREKYTQDKSDCIREMLRSAYSAQTPSELDDYWKPESP